MYRLYDIEMWHQHSSTLLREAREERLARRLGPARPRQKRARSAAALGFLAALVVSSLILVVGQQSPARADLTLTVNSTADPGSGGCNGTECTLREAIGLANRVEGADTIRFDIPGEEGVKTISPSSALPTITEAVTIDGYTQPGSSPNALARGTNAQIMVELDGQNAGNLVNGLEIAADDVVVRGLAIGGFRTGIGIGDAEGVGATSGVRIEGNFIGTDASGAAARTNDSNGININATGGDNTLGGTTPGERNLISGNKVNGINTSNTTGVEVLGNLIGTDRSGTSRLANGNDGVRIGGEGNIVGDLDPGDGLTNAANTIAFSRDDGVNIEDSRNHVVRNFIFSNREDGVVVPSDDDIRIRILSNSIHSNGDLGIDLGNDGVTPNDPGDVDSGPNKLQNKPGLASATNADGKTSIKGTLRNKPDRSFIVSFFSNSSGQDEGKTFIGQRAVRTDSEGKATFAFSPARKVGAGKTITATATGSEGTSEFSAPRTVVAQ